MLNTLLAAIACVEFMPSQAGLAEGIAVPNDVAPIDDATLAPGTSPSARTSTIQVLGADNTTGVGKGSGTGDTTMVVSDWPLTSESPRLSGLRSGQSGSRSHGP